MKGCHYFDGVETIESDEWLKQHEGHDVVKEVKEFPLAGGKATKKMHYRRCKDCKASHLYKMETVENG